MTFEIFKANIVNIHADAIVLPANEALKEGSGTSRAIFEAAGRKQLTKACKELGHCNTGSAFLLLPMTWMRNTLSTLLYPSGSMVSITSMISSALRTFQLST